MVWANTLSRLGRPASALDLCSREQEGHSFSPGVANLADSSLGYLVDIYPPRVDSKLEDQIGPGRQSRKKERDVFLTSQLKSKDPAMPEAGTSPGFLFYRPINHLLCLNQLQLGFCPLQMKSCSALHPSTKMSHSLPSRALTRGFLRDPDIGLAHNCTTPVSAPPHA